jgi:uncharacterized protein YoxC
MALVQTRVDDIDGTEAAGEFTFAVNGTSYAIDLSEANVKEFEAAIAGFVESARKVGKLATASTSKNSRASSTLRQSREQTAAIREWARKAGYNVSSRGRIPAEVQKAFSELA